jgi:uncharacterized protein YoxC
MKKEGEEKINLKMLIIIAICIIVIALIGLAVYILKNPNILESNISTENLKTIENEKLVLKSNSDYNKIIEFIFEDNNVKTLRIYEQFEEMQEYEEARDAYNASENFEVIKTDDQKLWIEIERKELGEEKDMSYDQVYDKYLVEFIDLYTLIK